MPLLGISTVRFNRGTHSVKKLGDTTTSATAITVLHMLPGHILIMHPGLWHRGGHLVDCDWRLHFYLGLGPPTKMNKKTHGKTHLVPDEAIGWAVGSKKRSTEEYREQESTRKKANQQQLTEARKARSQKAGRSARAQRTSPRVGCLSSVAGLIDFVVCLDFDV